MEEAAIWQLPVTTSQLAHWQIMLGLQNKEGSSTTDEVIIDQLRVFKKFNGSFLREDRHDVMYSKRKASNSTHKVS